MIAIYFTSLYDLGRKSHAAIEHARAVIACHINVEPEEIYFTSGGTESDNWEIFGSAWNLWDRHIITSKIEHHAVLNSCQALEAHGVEVTYVDVDSEGRVDPAKVRDAIRPDTVLVSVMAANNEIGSLQDAWTIVSIVRSHGALFHTDAVQAFGKEEIDVKRMNIDYLSASAHKLYCPKGIGFLYMRHEKSLPPLLYGGSHERNRRAETENVAGIVGLGTTVEIAGVRREEWNARETYLRNMLTDMLLEIDGCVLNGSRSQRLSNNVNISLAGIEGEKLVHLLNQRGIAAGTGSACSSGSTNLSHVLKAIGRSHEEAFSGIRFTLSYETTEQEIEITASSVRECAESLRIGS